MVSPFCEMPLYTNSLVIIPLRQEAHPNHLTQAIKDISLRIWLGAIIF